MEKSVQIFISIVSAIFFLAGNSAAQSIVYNISYGSDPRQTFDAYVPANKTPAQIQKLVLFIHGGGWSAGKKEDMYSMMAAFPYICPTCALVTMNYRLGSASSPGYPKQLEDIQLAINLLKKSTTPNVKFALLGASAGGHLSMLYGYKSGQQNNVKAIVNVVGPSDFTDPNVAYNPQLNMIGFSFYGPYVYCQRPDLYNQTSPVFWATNGDPPTISFFGKKDPLIPVTQGTLLKAKLDSVGVVNEMTYYEGGHFVDWTTNDYTDMVQKITKFFNTHF